MADRLEDNPLCSDIRDDLEMLVLGQLPSDRRPAVEDHLAVCQRCREIEQDYRMILHEVRHSARDEAPGDSLVESVQSAARAEIAVQKTRRTWRRMALAAGSAAAVLVLGIAGFHAFRRQAPAPDGQTIAKRSPVAVEKWRYQDQGAGGDAPGEIPVVRGNIFYSLQQARARSQIHAIDIRSGKLLWRSGLENIGFLAADDKRSYGLVREGPNRLSLVAMDAATGKIAWRYTRESPNRLEAPYRPAPLANGTVSWIVNSRLHILDSATGKPVWTRPVPVAGALSDVLAGNGSLYVAAAGALYCLDAQSGDELWSETLEAGASSYRRPLTALAGREIYIVRNRPGRRPQVLCMDIQRRRVLWEKNVAAEPQSILATDRGVLLRGSRILALGRADGRRIWSYPSAGCGPMTLTGGQIHFVSADRDGQVIALDQRTGREVWRIGGLKSCSSFTLIGDTGYIQTNDGVVRAIALAGPGRS